VDVDLSRLEDLGDLTGRKVIVRCDLKTAPMLGKKAGISVIQVSGTKHFTYPMDVRQAPFNDNNVRMALKHGINWPMHLLMASSSTPSSPMCRSCCVVCALRWTASTRFIWVF
jgi:hypothetical protein